MKRAPYLEPLSPHLTINSSPQLTKIVLKQPYQNTFINHRNQQILTRRLTRTQQSITTTKTQTKKQQSMPQIPLQNQTKPQIQKIETSNQKDHNQCKTHYHLDCYSNHKTSDSDDHSWRRGSHNYDFYNNQSTNTISYNRLKKQTASLIQQSQFQFSFENSLNDQKSKQSYGKQSLFSFRNQQSEVFTLNGSYHNTHKQSYEQNILDIDLLNPDNFSFELNKDNRSQLYSFGEQEQNQFSFNLNTNEHNIPSLEIEQQGESDHVMENLDNVQQGQGQLQISFGIEMWNLSFGNLNHSQNIYQEQDQMENTIYYSGYSFNLLSAYSEDSYQEQFNQKLGTFNVQGIGSVIEWTKELCIQQLCVICLQEFQRKNQLLKLECGHAFHKECMFPWMATRNSCPTCRASYC